MSRSTFSVLFYANKSKWCQDNLDWLRKTYGADNVVSAVLHMDEETPHIHATIVPIVQTERKKQKKEQTVKKRYRTKAPAPRLCADKVISRANLIRYQDTYAEQMAAYGLQRGIKGSEAQHISTQSITAARLHKVRACRLTLRNCWKNRKRQDW